MASDRKTEELDQPVPLRQSSEHLSRERDQTDDGLREERDKTDQVVTARQADLARQADAMVHHARDTADAVLSSARSDADAVLDAARDKADGQQASVEGDADQAAVEKERAVADSATQDERDSADEVLKQERGEYAKALRAFLPLEREYTDRSLRSERIRADQALLNRDDFLAIVAHDLRDLLGGISLSSKVLAARSPQGEASDGTLAETARIGRYVARMGRLIGDLVDIASIDAGKLGVVLVDGDLAVPIAEAIDTFRPVAASRGVTLESRVEAVPLTARFDQNRIAQVLGNLISNALKYTPQGGKVTLVGERDERDILLTVSDTGSGIPVDALDLVFERFTQVGADKHGGLGLGLYISRCLVEAHGGTIQAQSQPGAGARISVRLPTSV